MIKTIKLYMMCIKGDFCLKGTGRNKYVESFEPM